MIRKTFGISPETQDSEHSLFLWCFEQLEGEGHLIGRTLSHQLAFTMGTSTFITKRFKTIPPDSVTAGDLWT